MYETFQAALLQNKVYITNWIKQDALNYANRSPINENNIMYEIREIESPV
jgi:hypothetical protein